jgi:hypothetical protein
MEYKKGERETHPRTGDWGIGQVLAASAGGSAKVFFMHPDEIAIVLGVMRLVTV